MRGLHLAIALTLATAVAFAIAVSLGFALFKQPPDVDTGPVDTSGDVVTPLIASLVPQKAISPVRGTDGRYHVQYELVLTNTTSAPATLGPVKVLSGGGDRTLRTISVDDMVAGTTLRLVDRDPVTDTTIPGNEARMLFVAVAFGSRKKIPDAVKQRFSVDATNPIDNETRHFDYTIASVPLSKDKSPVLSPPLNGRGWLASDGCCAPGGHVAAIYGLDGKLQAAERYAIDWIKIDPNGRIYRGDPSVLSNWVGYGVKVRAMSGGVVTEAVNNLPDQTPLEKPPALPFAKLPGNNVVIKRGKGLREVYAHLIPGSVKVKVGQRVDAGQVIGRLGNSGGSLAPHLHFHAVNGEHVARSDGYPYVMNSFKVAGESTVGDLEAALSGKPGFPPRDQLHPVKHRDELPLGFTIDNFPSGGG